METLLVPTVTAQRGNWQRYHARKRNKAFLALAKSVHNRDKFTCRFCGFQAQQYQYVVNIDHNYSNNKSANLATACAFCAQCFFVDSLEIDGNTGGWIIYLPEITQSDLNHFCRVLFCSMLRDAPYKGKLQTCYLSLQDRGKEIDNVFGPNSCKANTFGQALIDSGVGSDGLQHAMLTDFRLLPDRKFFTKEIKYWKNNVFKQIPL